MMNKLSIRTKLILLIAFAILAMISVAGLQLLHLHETLITDKQTQLLRVTDLVFNQLQRYESQVKTGELSSEEAKAQARTWLKQTRYGNNDYFWIQDAHPNMIMHPFNAKLDGTDISNNTDKRGKKLFIEMIQTIKNNNGSGFVEYYWPKPGEEAPVAKLSHVREFAPWGWIIGTGIYIDDVNVDFIAATWRAAIVIVISIFIMLMVGLLVMYGIGQSVNRIQKLMHNIAQGGDYSKRLNPKGNTELDQLGKSMDVMFSAIQTAIKQVETVVGAAAQGDFKQRVTAEFSGDLRQLQESVNRAMQMMDTNMQATLQVMQGVANGDFSVRMDTRAAASIRNEVDRAMNMLQSVVSDVIKVAQELSQFDLSNRLTLKVDAQTDIGRLGSGINDMVNNLSQGIEEIQRVSAALASGDLSQFVTGSYKGELAKLKDSINRIQRSLREAVLQIIDSSQTVTQNSMVVSTSSTELAQRVQEQAASVEETAATLEQVTGQIATAASTANHASELVAQALSQAETAGQNMAQTLSAVDKVRLASERIGDIVGLIDSIAFQTNLLALNASVEAARAGEHGRGFAVVASEVRELAERAGGAAKEIKDLINSTNSDIHGMARLANQSGDQLHNIRQQVRQAASLVSTMANFSTEQAAAIQHIYQAMQQMDIVTQQNAQMVESTNQTAAKLQTEAKIMQTVINRFQVRREQNSSESTVHNTASEEKETDTEKPQAELLALPAPQ
jgi:methyl-accepting chemotaxis protein